MREPNIKGLIESLASENFMEEVFEPGRNEKEEIEQMMYFFGEQQAPTFYHEITELPEDKEGAVFASLVRLYPLSRNIIFYLLKKREKKPQDFLQVYDQDFCLLNQMKRDLETVQDNSSVISMQYGNYLKEIQKLDQQMQEMESEKQKLRNASDEVQEKRAKNQRLREELELLEKEDEQDRTKELQDNIDRLKRKKEKELQEKSKMEKELTEIKDSLSAKNFSKAYEEALTALEKCLKNTPEKG